MKKFTLAFVFDEKLEQVLLIHKNRPAWQVGKINGIGGKIEENEDAVTCVLRETEEETGLNTEKDAWIYLGEMHGKDWHIDVFSYIYTGPMSNARSAEDQKVEWFKISNLPKNVLPNLNWLIPFALDKIKNQEIETLNTTYNENNPT